MFVFGIYLWLNRYVYQSNYSLCYLFYSVLIIRNLLCCQVQFDPSPLQAPFLRPSLLCLPLCEAINVTTICYCTFAFTWVCCWSPLYCPPHQAAHCQPRSIFLQCHFFCKIILEHVGCGTSWNIWWRFITDTWSTVTEPLRIHCSPWAINEWWHG